MAAGISLEGTVPERPEVDILLLYNESEPPGAVDAVVERLESRELSVHYFRRDAPPGVPFRTVEPWLRSARGVVVVLGSAGYDLTQEELVREAQLMDKKLWTALIGEPPPQALDAFGEHPLVDLRTDGDGEIKEIADAVRPSPTQTAARRFDQVVLTLIDGSDADRALLLERIESGFPEAADLAARLRELVRTEFGPDQKARSERGMRDSNQFATIRSWMLSALIWLDAEHPDSHSLLLNHLDPSFEDQRPVRFWSLAGLVQRQPTYLGVVLTRAIEDPSPEVADLARAARDPDNPEFLDHLRRDLHSEEFVTAWHVLRLLRIVPLRKLATDICEQLGRIAEDTSLTYDALFALANPVMANVAKDILLERPGLARLAKLIIAESSSANAIAVRSFARLLTVFDQAGVRRALDAAARTEEDRLIVRTILRHIAEVGRGDGGELFIAGYASDTIKVGEDDLDIRRDVKTLAAVMLAREVVPPLAIGLFGAWGSGKSFFMRSIEAAADEMATKARETKGARFCGQIVQISFNAWHYSDANLWASLVSHILDRLSAHVVPGTSPAAEQALLEAQLASTKADIEAAEADRERAKQAVDQAQKTLGNLRVERERKEIRLRDLRASEFVQLLNEAPDLKTELTAALNQVGAPAAVESVGDLNRVVQESYSTGGRAAALFAGLLTGQNRGTVIACLLLLLAAPLVLWFAVAQLGGERLALLSAASGEIVALVAAVTVFLKRALSHAKTGLESLSSAKQRVDALLAKKRAEPSAAEISLEQEIAQARAGEQEAGERLSAASAQAIDLEQRVAALKESQSLGYFLTERTRSEDYRRHLGLISVIRKDFDTLVTRLQAPSDGNQPGVERIILYIDDLDRCPSNMVVDVLQAVHLLLAYPLFVVVVSVDPRWLLRSLEVRFHHFRHGGADMTDSWAATPQDFLEKIFQIPFSVRPMGERGYSRLMGRLLSPGTGTRATDSERNEQTRTDPGDAAPGAQDSQRHDATDGQGERRGDAPLPSDQQGADARPPRQQNVEIAEEALVIQPVESQFAGRLHAFIPTPRAAKRFANIYRLLKAPVGRDQLERHEGTLQVPGDFQLPMLLLALLIGHPDQAAYLFPQFLARARDGHQDFWIASGPDPEQSDEIDQIRREIGEIASEAGFSNSPQLVRDWLPKVARFSFVTARLAAEE